MNLKKYLVSFVIALIAVAVVFRVAKLRTVIVGA
jgi:hypothetical protein